MPYSDDRELLMDILKYGADCAVVGPPALRERVRAEIAKSGASYRKLAGKTVKALEA